MMKNGALLLIILLLNSCRRAEYPLTAQEEALKAKFARECKCKVTLTHSFYAVMNERTDGVFSVGFDFDSADKVEYCSKPEKWLRIYTQLRINQLLQVLSHKKNYKEVFVGYGVSKQIDEDNSEATCSKVLIYNLSLGKITYEVIR